jgi:hypothetical protein
MRTLTCRLEVNTKMNLFMVKDVNVNWVLQSLDSVEEQDLMATE